MAYILDDLKRAIFNVMLLRIFDRFEGLNACRLWIIGTSNNIHVAMAVRSVRVDCMKKHMPKYPLLALANSLLSHKFFLNSAIYFLEGQALTQIHREMQSTGICNVRARAKKKKRLYISIYTNKNSLKLI